MTDTTTTPAVYGAICAVTADLASEGISKNRRNSQGAGYNFRGIDDVYNALSRLLAEHKLCILPRVVGREFREAEAKSGGALYYTILTVEFDVVSAVDGSKHTVCTVGEAMDSSDKSTNKAMSAAYKYLAFLMFCIPTEGDNDTETHTHEPAPRRQTPAAPAKADPMAEARAAFASKGWTREQVDALGTTDVKTLEVVFRAALTPSGPETNALHVRAGKRVAEAYTAGVLAAVVEQHGKPNTWSHDTVNKIKASLGGAA